MSCVKHFDKLIIGLTNWNVNVKRRFDLSKIDMNVLLDFLKHLICDIP